jgi:2'-5' RNA ligase
MAAESALIVPIPEAEFLVSAFRERFPATAGVPAHVTLLYPFKPPHEIGDDVRESLAELFSRFQSFDVSFSRTKRFPGVLYLVPEPDETFRRLMEEIAKHFPETPAYGGKFTEVIPHLTVAEVGNSQLLDGIADEFERKAIGRLPIRASVREVCLIDNESGHWLTRQSFSIGYRDGRVGNPSTK